MEHRTTDSTITVNQAGRYTVTVTDGACSTTESITIIEKTTPTANGIQFINTSTCSYDFNVVNGQNIDSYSWNFGDGSANSTSATPSHAYTSSDTYNVVTLTNECGNTNKSQNVTCTLSGLEGIETTNFKIHPNPSENQVTIESNDLINSVTLTTITGQIVSKIDNINNTIKSLDVSVVENGIYNLTIETTNGVITKRIEVIK
ncbi:MAG: PKD domain-containing protein [Crocinitomicaceae bacterium]|nr:PKD domain-containing protein [Crocinitomicaceae bacterium]